MTIIIPKGFRNNLYVTNQNMWCVVQGCDYFYEYVKLVHAKRGI